MIQKGQGGGKCPASCQSQLIRGMREVKKSSRSDTVLSWGRFPEINLKQELNVIQRLHHSGCYIRSHSHMTSDVILGYFLTYPSKGQLISE
jgi:hypothetical protein